MSKVSKAAAIQKEQERIKAVKQAEKRGEYKYSSLKDCMVGEEDYYHFYAVVVDAQFPHKSFRTDRFVCTLRIIDPEQAMTDGVVEFCTLVLFANKF